jgi:hypothetical protein
MVEDLPPCILWAEWSIILWVKIKNVEPVISYSSVNKTHQKRTTLLFSSPEILF